METEYVLEVPSSLKQLARLVVRGFYSIEDALIIDMLVRNPCMKEDDICDLLKFERKMLRARIATLKADKFLQIRLKMETGPDGKAQKVNYYYINYKTFVNVVKYKLDHMRKRMETEERDATSRASFRCPNCKKTFTDLEADQLFDPMTEEFKCYMCRSAVEEDQSAFPKKDSRLLLARFNEQMEPLYHLLREVEDVKLAPSLLEPEPVDISHIQRDSEGRIKTSRPNGEHWSGEATRSMGFQVEEARVDVTIGDNVAAKKGESRKERPIWMVESTVITGANSEEIIEGSLPGSSLEQMTATISSTDRNRDKNDIMSVLLAHEKQSSKPLLHGVDSSDEESNPIQTATAALIEPASSTIQTKLDDEEIEIMESDEEDHVPLVTVGDLKVPLTDVNDQLIAKMTPAEKDSYIHLYQEYYAHIYD